MGLELIKMLRECLLQVGCHLIDRKFMMNLGNLIELHFRQTIPEKFIAAIELLDTAVTPKVIILKTLN